MTLRLLLLFGVSLAWAASYLFIGQANSMPAITATAAMTVIAAMVILPGVRYGLRRPLLPTLLQRPWAPMVMGVSAIALPNLTVVIAEHSVPPAVASLVGATVPIATILLTTFVTREATFSGGRLLGILLALGGLAAFLGVDTLFHHPAEMTGILIMMSGGLIFAVNGIFAARQTRDLDACALAAWTILFGAIALCVAALILEQPLATEFGGFLGPLLGEGIVGMGLAYLGYYLLVARAGADFAALYAFLVPPLGVLVAVLFDGHQVGAQQLLGMALLLAGLFLMVRRNAEAPSMAVEAAGSPTRSS